MYECSAGSGKIDLVPIILIAVNQLAHRNLIYSLVQAAANGHLSMLEWLHDNQRQGFRAIARRMLKKTKAMDNAAANGHLDVVEWLHGHHYKGCTTDAMDLAAANDHLEVVK